MLVKATPPFGLLYIAVYIIHRKKKDGNWYIYPQFLAHENPKNARKNAQKSYKNFKPLSPIGCVRFARYCGKMCSRHLFSYPGLWRCLDTLVQLTSFYIVVILAFSTSSRPIIIL